MITTLINRNDRVGNGTAGPFPFEFKIISKSDLTIYVNGSLKALGVEYEISGTSWESGGNVLFNEDYYPEVGDSIALIRALTLKQETDYIEGGKLPAAVVEGDFDKTIMKIQDLKESLIRTIDAIIAGSGELELILPIHHTTHEVGGVDVIDADTLDGQHRVLRIEDDHTHESSGAEGGEINYIKHALATAANDFLVGKGNGEFEKKTLVETQALLGGKMVQEVNVQTGEVATTSTQIPYDDTIPQITEGGEFMSLAITPQNATNELKIQVSACFAGDTSDRYAVGALFKVGVSDALACFFFYIPTPSTQSMTFSFKMVAGTTEEIMFKFRAGLGGTGILTFNGVSENRKFGGKLASSITITEIIP